MIKTIKTYSRAALTFFFLAALPLAFSSAKSRPASASDNADDSAAIKQAVAQYADAMNRHDGHVAALSFSDDADYVDAAGIAFHGRKGIDEGLTAMFADRLRTAHWDVSVKSIRFLTPQIVSVDNDWQSTGSKNPDGTARPIHTGVHTWIMTKQNGRWLIAIFHNQANIS